MGLIIIGFTALALIASIVFELFNGRDQKISTVAGWSVFLSITLNWITVWLINAPFTSFMTGGYFFLFFANLAIPVVVSFVVGSMSYDENVAGGFAGSFVILVAMIVSMFISIGSTPAWCNDEGLKAQISLLDIQPAPEGMTFHSTSLDQLIKVPASAALTKAGNELSGGQNVALGNYLQPAVAYLTHVQGIPMYVIDLKVTNAMGYRNSAGQGQEPTIPGYLIVNAIDGSVPAELRLGYRIVYAPEALFSYDLDRKVYFDYALPDSRLISDLDGMEIDDELTPSYTGTVMGHPLSYKTTAPIGIYKLDPTTGLGEFIPLSEVPTKLPYLDRVYPLEWVIDQVTLWGKFANHASCDPFTNNGQVQIDSYNEVVTPNGIEYQITMTGMGNDPSMTQLITVDAQTGKGYIFPTTGKSVESIKDQFKGLTKELRIDGLNVDECELHALDGVNTVYCIFTNADQYGNTNISGYGFVAIDRAENDADYALADTFDEAYNEFLKIRSTADSNTVVTNTADDVTIVGTVISNEPVSTDDGFTRLINVKGDDGLEYWLMADGSSKNAAAATVGRHVTVTAYQREGQQFMTVRYITSDGVPDFGGNLLWDEFSQWLQSINK